MKKNKMVNRLYAIGKDYEKQGINSYAYIFERASILKGDNITAK